MPCPPLSCDCECSISTLSTACTQTPCSALLRMRQLRTRCCVTTGSEERKTSPEPCVVPAAPANTQSVTIVEVQDALITTVGMSCATVVPLASKVMPEQLKPGPCTVIQALPPLCAM